MKKNPKATKRVESDDLKLWLPVCVWLKGGLSYKEWRALSSDDKNAVVQFCDLMAGGAT